MWKWLILPVFYLLYWGMCFLATGSDEKNLKGLRSYPKETQGIVREKVPAAPKRQPVYLILLSNLLLFGVAFFLLGVIFRYLLPFDSYLSSFLYFLALGEGLGLFDLLIIDLMWWRHSKRIRFSFLPQDSYYQNPKEHLVSFIRGIPLFLGVAALAALSYFL